MKYPSLIIDLKKIEQNTRAVAAQCKTEIAAAQIRCGTVMMLCEIVEILDKPSKPFEKIEKDVFGNVPYFEDKCSYRIR